MAAPAKKYDGMKASKALKPGWRRVKFGDVVRLSKTRCQDPLAEGYERFIGLEHIDPEDLRIRRWGNVADGTTFTNVFKPGQVLFGKRRAYQRKVAVADFGGVCSGDIYVLESRDANTLLPELLPFICQTDAFFEHAVGTSVGSLSPRTNWTSLADFEFVLLPMEEQKKLRAAFSALAKTVYAYELAEIAASAYHAALREEHFSKSATEVYLGELLKEIQAGKSLVGVDEPPKDGQEKAVLKVSAVGKHTFLPSESKTLSRQDEFIDEHAVRHGDVLITRANTPDLVGLVCLVSSDHSNLMLSDKTLRLIPKTEIPGLLLVECLRTQAARQYLKANATGTGGAMKNISQAKLREMPVRFPRPEQRQNLALAFEAAIAVTAEISSRVTRAKDMQRISTQEILVGGESVLH